MSEPRFPIGTFVRTLHSVRFLGELRGRVIERRRDSDSGGYLCRIEVFNFLGTPKWMHESELEVAP